MNDVFCFFFFKQKTAYEMRISDWSSDVCSSDLAPQISLADFTDRNAGLIALTGGPAGPVGRLLADGQDAAAEAMLTRLAVLFEGRLYVEIGRASWRERVCQSV